MSFIYNSTGTAELINRAMKNNQGTTTTSDGADADGNIITENLQYIIESQSFSQTYTKTLSGIVPLVFHAVTGGLNYTIYGESEQSATPTELAPCTITSCGDYVSDGEHSGEYDIPLVLNDVTSHIYLTTPLYGIDPEHCDTVNSVGTVTRNIKKIEFDGTENWTQGGGADNKAFFKLEGLDQTSNAVGLCTHFVYENVGQTTTNIAIYITSGGNVRIRCTDIANTSVDDFKTWLAAQNTNGTPVTLYYVKTDQSPETTTSPTLTTATGYNNFNVDTEVIPSNVVISYIDN